MKKSKYLNIISLASIAGVLTPTIVLSSCSSSHFDNLSTDKKERTSEEGEFTCTFSLDLKEALKEGQSINVEITQTSASENTSIELNEQAVTEDKTVTFETVLQLTANADLPSFYAKFDAKIKCLDSNQATVWQENIKDFKHTVKCEKHSTSATSKVDNVELEVDKKFITEYDTITLKFNNKRTTKVVDANLTVKINDQHINTSIELADNAIPVGQSEVTFTKAKLQELFTEYTIQPTDTIEFYLVRSGAYKVVDNQLYVFDDFNESSAVTTDEQWTKVEKKILVKDLGSNDFVLHENLFDFLAQAPVLDDDKHYDVYLLNGTYFSAYWARTLAKARFDLHGIEFNSEKKASIRAYKTDDEGRVWNYGVEISENIGLNLNNLIILGNEGERLATTAESDYSRGLMSTDLKNITNCYFKGCYTQWWSKTTYTECTFDSTYTWKIQENEEIHVNEVCNNYAIWVNTDAQAWFKSCTFKSGGKCIKLYPGLKDSRVNVVESCTFILDQTKLTPLMPSGQTEIETKSIINIGTEELTGLTADLYYKDLVKDDTFPSDITQYTGSLKTSVTEHPNEVPATPW